MYKIRVWNKTTNEWAYFMFPDNIWDFPKYDYDWSKSGRFTGLVDKNGREIYDGDLDKSGMRIAWNQLHCCCGLFSDTGFQVELLADWIDERGNTPKEWISTEIEVIGTIHDTKL